MTDTTDTTNTADVGLEADDIWGDVDFGIDFDSMSTDEIRQRRVMIENEIKILIIQNFQWDNIMDDISPTFKINNQIHYVNSNLLEFEGGNEYYNFDNKD